MKLTTPSRERLPKVAVVGLFQGGKSLLINAALGGAIVPVGKFGLRTTLCKVRCVYGELSRAVVHQEGLAPLGFSIRALSAYVEALDVNKPISQIEFFHSHSLLRQIELFDTPGIDFSEHDDHTALEAARGADAVVLVAQQSLPTASSSFLRLADCLRGKPWGLVLNCGRAGPHLEHSDSPASKEVEEHCVRQLLEAGLHRPIFTQRMSARTLSYYASEQFEAAKSVRMSEEHLEDLAADEESVRTWRKNLLRLGDHWLDGRLEHVRNRVITSLHKQEWSDPKFTFEAVDKSFECRVGFEGHQYKVTGRFRLESMNRYDRVVLYDFKCRDEWVVEWLKSERKWNTWEI